MKKPIGHRVTGLTPVARSTFRDQVAERLRLAIISGELPPGSAVTELALSAKFAVSRGPIREAMRQLEEEGLLSSVAFKETRIASISIDDVREIYSLRTAIETFAFREVWDKRDRYFRDELVERHRSLQEILPHADSYASSLSEVRFHSLVYEACGHRLLHDLWRHLAGRLQLYLALHQSAHARTGPLRDAHDDYVRLALGDDLDAMIGEVEAHMQRGIGRLEAFLAERRDDTTIDRIAAQ